MKFRVLGPVEVWSAGQLVDVGHVKQRAVLAVLLLDLGKVVPIGLLIDRVWGDHPPPSVRNNVYAYVARIRAVIAGAGDDGIMLTRRQGGYLLEADPEKVDLYGFRRRVRQAAEADDQRAARLLGEALALWRGPALADLHTPWLSGMRDALEQQRMEAVLERGDIALRQGQHAALSSTLAEEAVASPTNERLIRQLMMALYRSGRQAEALRWFEQTRRHLVEELGTDPGPELKTLHQQILRTDPALAGPTPAGRDGAPPPRELPADVRAFTGRSAQMADLDRLEIGAATEPAAMVISVISGTAGVGKTALAVHWAHQVAGCFPDGQLYVNLCGYDPSQPMPAAVALAGFLRALGVPGQDIPAAEEERAARYRTLLAGRRMLVVLDNAASAQQVRPLLTGTPTCVTLVTSRDSLAGLVARDGAQRLDLDLLPLDEAVGLLRALIGDRVDTEPDATIALAERCCRLPLALRVAAELSLTRKALPLGELASELADERRRLDMLDAGADPRTAARSVFSWSYRHLDDGAARALRLAGLCPGPDFDRYAAAALTGTALDRASHALDLLARAHLIQHTRPGRYGMHDLLRAYACELAAAEDDDDEQQAALTRLFDYYLHAAATAVDVLRPAERHLRPRVPAAAGPAPCIAGQPEALAWLDAERPNLVAAARHAADYGWPGHATNLSTTLSGYLRSAGNFPEAIIIHGHALRAARRSGDRIAEASALLSLGSIVSHQGRYQQATDYLDRALALFREAADQAGEALTLNSLGIVHMYLGCYPQAAHVLQLSLALARKTGDKFGQSIALGNLGVAERNQGHLREAAANYEQTLALCRETGERSGLAETLVRFGFLNLQQDRQEQAFDQFRQALAIFREIGERPGEARALMCLGEVNLRQGRYQRAADQLQQALAIFREIGDQAYETRALNGLGEASLLMGRSADACAWYAAELEVASRIALKFEQARAHDGLGRGYHATGDLGQARHHWQEALAIFTDIGAAETEQVRARLIDAAGDNCEQ